MNKVSALIVRLFASILAFGIMTGAAQGDTVVQVNLNCQMPGIYGLFNSFQVQLFDSQAPGTVENFLEYVNNDVYDGTIFHRSIEDFMIQGGGFELQVNPQHVVTAITPITNYGPITSEFSPSRSNVRGTIAMALSGTPSGMPDVNSGSNQWFVNVSDNYNPPYYLDYQGFTVFGHVAGEGMTIVDAINGVQTYNINPQYYPSDPVNGPFKEVPLLSNGSIFVTVTSASVVPTVEWVGGAAPAPTDWALATNWKSGVVPGGVGVNLSIGSQASANNVIDLGAADRTVGNIYFTSNTPTTIQSSGGKKLILNNNTNNNVSLINVIGNHEINSPVFLNNNAIISTVGLNGSLVMSGEISGTGGFAKNNPGWLVLTNTNTYTGTTLVTNGVLETRMADSLPGYDELGKVKVYADAWLGVLAGAEGEWDATQIHTLQSKAVFNSGSVLAIDTLNADFTYDQVLGGSLGLAKISGNKLTLTDVNTYTGETLLLGGTLEALKAASLPGYDSPGKVQVFPQIPNTTLAVRVGGSGEWTAVQIDTLRSNATFSNDNFDPFLGIDTTGGDFTYASGISGNLGLTKSGSNTLTLTGTNNFTGDVNFNGGFIKAAALNKLGSNNEFNFNGGGLQFDAAFDPSLRTMTFQAGGATLDTQTYDITLSNPVGNGGEGGLSKQGAGLLILSASPNYKGATFIDGGTLKLGTAGSGVHLPNTTGVILIGSGTKLETSGNSQTIAYLWGVEASEVHLGGGTLTTGNDISITTYSGSITGSGGSLTKVGSGTFAIDGVNTYTGKTLVSGGMLEVGKAASLPGHDLQNMVTVNSGAVLTVWAGADTEWLPADIDKLLSKAIFNTGSTLGIDTTSDSFEYDNVIHGNMGLTKMGSNTLTLTGANSYAGNTSVDLGVLKVGKAASLPGYNAPGKVTVDSVLIVQAGTAGEWTAPEIHALQSNAVFNSGAVLAIDNSNADLTYNSVLGGNLSLAKLGSKNLILSGDNNYTGNTLILNGTLEVLKAASLPGYDTQDKVEVSGNTILTVRAGASGEWQSTEIDDLLNNAVFNANSFLGIDTTGGGFDYDYGIGGNLGLIKMGINTLTLTGDNTYAGYTIIRKGTLTTGKAGSLPGYDAPSKVVVDTGATLALRVGAAEGEWSETEINTLGGNASFNDGSILGFDTTSGDFTYGGAIAGNVDLIKLGSNVMELTGEIAYTGATTIDDGILKFNNNLDTTLSDISGDGNLTVDGANTVLTANSLAVNSLTVGPGSKIVIAPMAPGLVPILDESGLSHLGGYITPVPEPSALLLLSIAAAVGLFTARRRK